MPVPGKTYSAKPSEITAGWFIVDASGQTLGRLAANVAKVLRGKHKPTFTPHLNSGDHVIVINAAKVRFTGRKLETKTYQSYSHYPGGQKQVTAKEMLSRRPERILREAVRRMVPRNRLGRQQMTKLKIYAGPNHPHQAQKPEDYKVKE